MRGVERQRGDDGDVVGQPITELTFDCQFVDDDDCVIIVGANEGVDDDGLAGTCGRDNDSARVGRE